MENIRLPLYCNKRDFIGKKINKLTVLEIVDTKEKRTFFKCICECGKEIIVSRNALRTGNTKSCGCLALETKKENGRKLSPLKYDIDTRKDDIYKTYCRMLRRCYWKDSEMHKKYYESKGIKVCDEWKNDFMAFKKWALENGYRKGLAIDRINANDDYKPSNCRFITISENSKRVEHKKGVFCLSDKEKAEIFIKRKNGYKLKNLALEYNVSLSTIKKTLCEQRRNEKC